MVVKGDRLQPETPMNVTPFRMDGFYISGRAVKPRPPSPGHYRRLGQFRAYNVKDPAIGAGAAVARLLKSKQWQANRLPRGQECRKNKNIFRCGMVGTAWGWPGFGRNG
jgi:hypothetical protein